MSKEVKRIESYYRQIKRSGLTPITKDDKTQCYIHKGFILCNTSDTYTLNDCRFSDFYSEVSEEDMRVIVRYGFIRGTEILQYERDKDRVQQMCKKLERQLTLIEDSKNKIKTDPKFFLKKIRVNKRRLAETLDLLFFFKIRLEQFNKNINKTLLWD